MIIQNSFYWYKTERFLPALCVLYFSFGVINVFAETPQNPYFNESGIFVSEQGVYRFNPNDMSLSWSALTSVHTFEPVVVGDKVFVGSTQGLFALDIQSGEMLWQIEKDKTIFSPQVFGQHLYSGSFHGQIYDVSSLNGSIHWTSQFDGWVYSPVVKSVTGLLWTGGQAHQAMSISMDSGKHVHSIELEQEVIFSPVDTGKGSVGYNLFNGTTVIINSDSGIIQNKISGVSQARHLVVNEGVIYRSSRDGLLTAIKQDNQIKTGNGQLWQKKIYDTDLSIHPSLNRYLLLSDDDQNLQLLDLEQRNVLWGKKLQGRWFSPFQINPNKIVVFYRDVMNFHQPKAVVHLINHNN